MAEGWLKRAEQGEVLLVEAGGVWTLDHLVALDRELTKVEAEAKPGGQVRIRLDSVERLDTAGAWLICRTERALGALGAGLAIEGGASAARTLLERVRSAEAVASPETAQPWTLTRLVERVGRATVQAGTEARDLLAFFGLIVVTLARTLVRPARLRLTPLAFHLEQTGLAAMPIVGLISFLIGIVLAYQGADQLRQFGVEIFTVDLLGVSVLRELGILLTAIVVAGRSGSAFTAQIGTMQVNEEVDAIRTLGLDPIELLVLPRLLALMIALPLLAFYANMMALLGGGLMCLVVLDIAPGQFLRQLEGAITPTTLWVGLAKAPVFAFLIAMVGCFEGLKVRGSAESVGRLTTQSVVVSIFLVIIFDALFSVLFSYLGI
jgi:phospholipid/cholesterol/gamma-HCH transport system permease protein